MKILVFFLVVSVFLGTDILALPLPVLQLSMYRITVLVTTFVFVAKIMVRDPKVNFSLSDRINSYQVVYLTWLLYAIVSVLWAESTSRWIFGVFFVGLGVMSIFYITFFIREERDLKILFYIFFFMSAFQQWLGWYELFINRFVLGNSSYVPTSTFGNINDYATLILAGMFFGLIVYFFTSKLAIKLYTIFHLFSGLALLLISGSRGNLLALFVGIFTLLVVNILNSRHTRKIAEILLILFTIMFLAFILIPPVQTIGYNILDSIITNFFRKGGSNRYRINLLLNGFAFLVQTFGLGVGAGNIEYWLQNKPVFPDIDAVNMHNWFMEILTAYGVFIFIIYVVMYIYITRQLYKNYRYSNNQFIRSTSMVLFTYVIAFLISSISSASNIFIEWQWVMWGIIIAFTSYSERKQYSLESKTIKRDDHGQIIRT